MDSIDFAELAKAAAPVALIEIAIFYYYAKTMSGVLSKSDYDPTLIKRPTSRLKSFFDSFNKHRITLVKYVIIGFCALAIISLYLGKEAIILGTKTEETTGQVND